MAKKRRTPGAAAASSRTSRSGWAGAVWAVPLLAAVVYANTLGFAFTLDDLEIVERNPLVTDGVDLPSIFGSPYWGHVPAGDQALYRPVTIATYAVQHAVGGGGPGGFHAVNLGLHALVSLALALLVRTLFRDDRIAVVAGALFAVHAIHTEAVAGIVGRAEILALGGMLAAVWAWFRAADTPAHAAGRRTAWLALSVAAYLGGSLSKEGGLVAPALVLLAEAFLPARRWLLRGARPALVGMAAWLGAAALVLMLRAAAVSGRSVNEGFADVSGFERFLTGLRVCGEYVGLLVAPVRLSADYWVTHVPIARSLAEPGVLVALVVAAVLGAAAWRFARTRPAVAWGLAAFAVTLFPVSNLAFPIGVIKAERLLYAPSAGFVTAAAALVAPLLTSRRARWPVGAAVAIIVLLLGGMTLLRNEVWRNNCTLAAATMKTSPDSPLIRTMHARCLFDAGHVEDARAHLDHVLRLRPDYPTAHLVYGILEREAKRWEPALARFERVLAREPNHRVALDNAAWVAFHLGRFDRSAELYERRRRTDPQDPGPWAAGIAATVRSGRLDDAQRLAEEALRRFPNHPDVQNNAMLVRRLRGDSGP